MDEIHTMKENCVKIEALLAAVLLLNSRRNELPEYVLIHEIESLAALAKEAKECFEAIRYKAL